jgi:hypothetical protein
MKGRELMEGKIIGWWVVELVDGTIWATDRYEGDSLLKAYKSAVMQFGSNIKFRME